MTGHSAISLWDISSEEPALQQSLDGDISTCVAIVGGGFTGLSTALHLAGKGLDCVVLEAEKIGFGGSGRNVGLVNAGLWLPPQDIRAALGETKGAAFVKTLGEAPEYVFSLIDQYQIHCEPTRTGTLHAAHSPRGFQELQRRCQEWQRLGAPVKLLDKAQAASKIGCDVFYGGLLDHRAGTINPMAYVRGLARAAQQAGADIRTGAAVHKLERQRDNWLLQTRYASIRAESVVLATNAYTDALWPGLKRVFTLIHYFQLATQALGDRAQSILPDREGLWTTGSIMFSLRRDAFGRLLIGSMGKIRGDANGLSQRWARKQLNRLFPQLGPVEFDQSWHGQIAMTPDHLPRILQLDQQLYSPIGYNGRGITTGTILGRAMAELLADGDQQQLPLPLTPLDTVKSAPLMSKLYETAFTAHKLTRSVI